MRASGRSPGSRFASCAHDAAQAHENALNALELLISTEPWKAMNPQETRQFLATAARSRGFLATGARGYCVHWTPELPGAAESRWLPSRVCAVLNRDRGGAGLAWAATAALAVTAARVPGTRRSRDTASSAPSGQQVFPFRWMLSMPNSKSKMLNLIHPKRGAAAATSTQYTVATMTVAIKTATEKPGTGAQHCCSWTSKWYCGLGITSNGTDDECGMMSVFSMVRGLWSPIVPVPRTAVHHARVHNIYCSFRSRCTAYPPRGAYWQPAVLERRPWFAGMHASVILSPIAVQLVRVAPQQHQALLHRGNLGHELTVLQRRAGEVRIVGDHDLQRING